MLEQADRLPDLQSDFTASNYRMMFRKAKALTSGLRPDQITPEKLRELLEEMERLGRKGDNWGGDAMEGMEALEGGQPDRALEAMQKALERMRAQEEAQRAGKGLRGGRERDRTASRDQGRGADGGMPDEHDFGEGEGMLPGRGTSPHPKGEATDRLRANPYDVGVEGESRDGRKDGFDTNLTGRGGPMASRLQYLGVIGQYRKLLARYPQSGYGDNAFFAATGITDGELLQGVHYDKRGATTESLVMRSKSGTVRRIDSRHRLSKLREYASIEFG